MIPKEAIEAAISAYMKETDTEPHHLEGWFEPAMSAALTAAFAAMSGPVAFRWKYFPEGNWAYDEKTPKEFTLRDPAVIEPLYAAPQPAAVKVKVKPLEWSGHFGKSLSSETLCYRVFFNENGAPWGHAEKGRGFYAERDIGFGAMIGGPFENREAAKAAAQSDYERRILSALEGGGE